MWGVAASRLNALSSSGSAVFGDADNTEGDQIASLATAIELTRAANLANEVETSMWTRLAIPPLPVSRFSDAIAFLGTMRLPANEGRRVSLSRRAELQMPKQMPRLMICHGFESENSIAGSTASPGQDCRWEGMMPPETLPKGSYFRC